MKDSCRTKKLKDGSSKVVGNAVDGNLGEKGNWKNNGPTTKKRSKNSGNDNASSRKTSGKAMNKEESGRTKMRKVGFSKGDGDEVGGISKVTGSRGETALGMRAG